MWDIRARKLIQTYQNKAAGIQSLAIDPGGKILASAEGNTCKLVDINSGKTKHTLKSHRADIGSVLFSPDGKTVLTNAYDTTACLWNVNDGSLIERFEGHFYESNPVYFAPDGSIVRPPAFFDTITITDVATGEESFRLLPVVEKNPANFCVTSSASGKYRYLKISPRLPGYFITNTIFDLGWNEDVNTISNDEKILAFAFYWTDSLHLADPVTGTWTRKIKIPFVAEEREYAFVTQLLFTPDDKHLLIVHRQGSITVLDSEYRFVKRLPGELCRTSIDGDLLCILNNGKIDVYDASTLQPLYTYVSINDVDYLVVDPLRRYDGTLPARQLLYFTCANEVIGLDQFKDRLWVPGLAGRIISKEEIYTPGIDKLKICGYTPRVQLPRDASSLWEYLVEPGDGGLGETVVYVNGIEVKRFRPDQLRRSGRSYVLKLDSSEIRSFFIAGEENLVVVKAFVADNSVSSRGFERKDSSGRRSAAIPNLYAVMIGVSDYKGDRLDLRFASKDASDLASVIKTAASKLLNNDGNEHVFVYRIITDANRYRMPEKFAIKKTLEEIAAKATPNDIVLIFFAGHGVMHPGTRQFYFLTSEASEIDSEADLSYSGISTAELTEWIKPSSLKAQKRILIFDACNSGQVIRDLLRVGEKDQGYVAARNDDKAQQLKLIEKLNDRAGFTILSASASDQSAYEIGDYAQGLLTYALLKSLRDHPDILIQGKFLDLGRWFQQAGSTVEELIRTQSTRQEPQFIANTNYIIGVVDKEVLDSIQLPSEKKVLIPSIVTDREIGFDQLGLTRKLNDELSRLTAGEDNDFPFVFRAQATGTGVYSLNGVYTVQEDKLQLRISLVKDNQLVDSLSLEGRKTNVDDLVNKTMEWLRSKKWQ